MVVRTLVRRIVDGLPVNALEETHESSTSRHLTLIRLARTSPNHALHSLVAAMAQLRRTKPPVDGQPWVELERSQLILLDLIQKCIMSSRSCTDTQSMFDCDLAQKHRLPDDLARDLYELAKPYLVVTGGSLEQGEKARIASCDELYRVSARVVFVDQLTHDSDTRTREYLRTRMRSGAMRIIAMLSASNWDLFFGIASRAVRREAAASLVAPLSDMLGQNLDVDVIQAFALWHDRIQPFVSLLLEVARMNVRHEQMNVFGFGAASAFSNWVRMQPADLKKTSEIDGIDELYDLVDEMASKQTFRRLLTVTAYLHGIRRVNRSYDEPLSFQWLRKNAVARPIGALFVFGITSYTGALLNQHETFLAEFCDKHRKLLLDSLASTRPHYLDIVFMALYELREGDLMKSLLAAGMEPKAPLPLKVSLFAAMESLVRTKEVLFGPWKTDLSRLIAGAAHTFEQNFVAAAVRHHSQRERLGGLEEGVYADQELSPDAQLVRAALCLASAKPAMLYLVPFHKRDSFNTALGNCLWFEDTETSRRAEDILLALQTPFNVVEERTHERIIEWSALSSASIVSLTKRLVDGSAAPARIRGLVRLVDACLERRFACLAEFSDLLGRDEDLADHVTTMTAVEVAVLTLLCHADVGVCTASACLARHLSRQAGPYPAPENRPMYEAIASEDFVLLGRNAVQKKLRRLLRMAELTPGVRAAWVSIFSKWSMCNARQQEYNHAIAKGEPPAFEYSQHSRIMWHHCAGFLASVNFRTRGRPVPGPLKSFTEGLLSHILLAGAVTREAVVDIVSNDLNPALLPVLIPELQTILTTVLGRGVMIMRDRNTTVVDQLVTMLRGCLERFDKTRDFLADTSLGALISLVSMYIRRIGELTAATRMRHRFARVCELIAQNCYALGIESEINFKREMRAILQSWVQRPEYQSQDLALRELNLQCLRSLAGLADAPFGVDRTNDKVAELESFIRFCVELSERYSRAPDMNESLLSQKRATLHRLMCITLRANADIAMPLYLDLALSAQTSLRSTFLAVLLDYSRDSSPLVKFSSLVATITGSRKLTIVVAEGCDSPEPLLALYDSVGRLRFLLSTMIEYEVSKVSSEGSLLRQNCITTKLWAAYARRVGQDYLRKVLEPAFVFDKVSLTLDPARVESAAELADNAQNLMRISQAVVDSICSSASRLPAPLKEVCHILSDLVARRFPEARYTAVGALIILRFVSPAIVTMGGSRDYVMVAKVVTNLANNVLFKEPFMRNVNDFLEANVAKMTRFFYELATEEPNATIKSVSLVSNVNTSGNSVASELPKLLQSSMPAMRKMADELSAQDELESAARLLERIDHRDAPYGGLYHAGINRQGVPVYCLRGESSLVIAPPYELFIDAAEFSGDIPKGYDFVTVLNPNFAFRKYLEDCDHDVSKFRFTSSLHDLTVYYDYAKTSLPVRHVVPPEAPLQTFEDAVLVLGSQRINVSLRFTDEVLILVTQGRIDAGRFGNLTLFEAYRIDELLEVMLVRLPEGQLLFIRDQHRPTLQLQVKLADAFVATVRTLMEKRPLMRSRDPVDPPEISARLHHTALHNLSSLDAETRGLATQILDTLQQDGQLVTSRGHLPMLSAQHIEAYSNKSCRQAREVVSAFIRYSLASITRQTLVNASYAYLRPWLERLIQLEDAAAISAACRQFLVVTTVYLDVAEPLMTLWETFSIKTRGAHRLHSLLWESLWGFARMYAINTREVSAVSRVLRAIDSDVLIAELMTTFSLALDRSAAMEVEFDGRELLVVLQLCTETSYMSRTHSEDYLAELFYATIVLAGKLPGATEFTRQVCFNLAQNLQVDSIQPKFETAHQNLRPDRSYGHKLKFFNLLLEAMRSCLSRLDPTQWDRLSVMLAKTAATPSRAQGRAILAAGALARPQDVDRLLRELMNLLVDALADVRNPVYSSGIIFSAAFSFRDLVLHSEPGQLPLARLAVMALCLMQVHEDYVAIAALELFDACISRNPLVLNDVFDVEITCKDVMQELHDFGTHIGVRFGDRMPFAVAAMLLQGRFNSQDAALTRQVLISILTSISDTPNRRTSISPFLAMLLHMAKTRDEQETLLKLAGLEGVGPDEDVASAFFAHSEIPDNTHALLLLSLIASLFEVGDGCLHDYALMAEASAALPEVFPIIYVDLVPWLEDIIARSKNPELLALIDRIILTVVDDETYTRETSQRSRAQYLEDLGFTYLASVHPHHRGSRTAGSGSSMAIGGTSAAPMHDTSQPAQQGSMTAKADSAPSMTGSSTQSVHSGVGGSMRQPPIGSPQGASPFAFPSTSIVYRNDPSQAIALKKPANHRPMPSSTSTTNSQQPSAYAREQGTQTSPTVNDENGELYRMIAHISAKLLQADARSLPVQ
ncbi:Ras GTPase activating protein ira2 [Savitreella phatthalungensis]